MAARLMFVIALLVALAPVIWPRQVPLGTLFKSWSDTQAPLSGDAESRGLRFSVGLTLHSSYGAATVIFDGPDGAKEVISRVVQGDAEYRDRMAMLSLEESRHLAPPYDDDGQYYADLPRRMKREALKKAGYPASHDVAVLARLTQKLVSEVESEFGIEVSSATMAVEHLVALYQDDIEDLCDYLKLECATPVKMFKPLFWETSAAYAGYGLGLCEHYKNKTACDAEDGARPEVHVLAVHHSRAALGSSLAVLWDAAALSEPDLLHLEDFTLGRDAVEDFPSSEEYWGNVRRSLLRLMVENPYAKKPEAVIVTGDMVDDTFIGVLKDTLQGHLGKVPQIYSEGAATVASKGAAEFKRRIPYYRS